MLRRRKAPPELLLRGHDRCSHRAPLIPCSTLNDGPLPCSTPADGTLSSPPRGLPVPHRLLYVGERISWGMGGWGWGWSGGGGSVEAGLVVFISFLLKNVH